jgi:type IV secretion system protein VirB10
MRRADSIVDSVAGERGATLVNRSASMQSRLSNLLAIGLMSALGVGTLVWYYASTVARQSRAREQVRSAAVNHAQGDSTLPSLGRIDPPPIASEVTASAFGDRAPPVAPPTLDALPAEGLVQFATPPNVSAPASVPPPPTPGQIAEQRQLSGSVYSGRALGTGGTPSAAAAPVADSAPPSAPPRDVGQSELSGLLQPSVTTTVRAEVLPAQRLLLPKGAFVDCTLETAIDSTLPGMTTCITATDVFGVDGNVVLLERGTKLIGETRGQVQQGSARVFVIWTEARTPTGVVVPLSSPGADELGRSGLPGEVNRHFWERFGAAMLISVIDGAVETAAQSSRGGGGTVIVDPSTSQGVLTEVLKGTVNISPTVTKRNGDRIQVLVARDLDFRSVYELRSVTR